MKTLYWDTCKYSSHLSDSNIVITLFCWFFPQSFRPTFKSDISKNCKAILYSAQQQQLNNLDFIKNFSAVRHLKKLPFIEQQNLPLGSNMHDIQRSGFQSKMHSLLTVSSMQEWVVFPKVWFTNMQEQKITRWVQCAFHMCNLWFVVSTWMKGSSHNLLHIIQKHVHHLKGWPGGKGASQIFGWTQNRILLWN